MGNGLNADVVVRLCKKITNKNRDFEKIVES